MIKGRFYCRLQPPDGLEHSKIVQSFDIDHVGCSMRHFGLKNWMLSIANRDRPFLIYRGHPVFETPNFVLLDEAYYLAREQRGLDV